MLDAPGSVEGGEMMLDHIKFWVYYAGCIMCALVIGVMFALMFIFPAWFSALALVALAPLYCALEFADRTLKLSREVT